jgi:hypothetical protein
MKKCGGICGKLRDYSFFSKKGDGYQSKCRECNKKYQKEHYKTNKPYYAKKAKKQRITIKQKIVDLKEQTPCKDCGDTFPYYHMEFDHIAGVKKYNVSEMAHDYGWDTIQDEISKCKLVCVFCHRTRTHRRSGKCYSNCCEK